MRLIYLGSPYTDPDKAVMEERLSVNRKALAHFANNSQNLCVYSPLVHWSSVADAHDLPHDFSFWMTQDFHMIRQANALWILAIDGWHKSYGLSQEIEFAESIDRPINFVIPNRFGFVLRDHISTPA